MSLEYCDKCRSDVMSTQVYMDTDSYIWECPICNSRYTIQYIPQKKSEDRFGKGKNKFDGDLIDWPAIRKVLAVHDEAVVYFKKHLGKEYACLPSTDVDIYLAEMIARIEDKFALFVIDKYVSRKKLNDYIEKNEKDWKSIGEHNDYIQRVYFDLKLFLGERPKELEKKNDV